MEIFSLQERLRFIFISSEPTHLESNPWKYSRALLLRTSEEASVSHSTDAEARAANLVHARGAQAARSRRHLLVQQLRSGAAPASPRSALRAPPALRAREAQGNPAGSGAAGRAGITTLRLRSGRVTQAGCRRGNPAPVQSNPPHLQPGVLRAGGENPYAFALGLCPVGWETRSKWS